MHSISTLSLKTAFVSLSLLAAIIFPSVALAGAMQDDLACRGAGGTPSGDTCVFTNAPEITGENSILRTVTNILLFLVGASAVIAIIVNGLRMVFSGGDPQAVAGARQGIIYGIIGVVVAFMGFAIVQFVNREISNPDRGEPSAEEGGGGG